MLQELEQERKRAVDELHRLQRLVARHDEQDKEAAKAADLAAGVLPPQAAQVAGGGLAEAGTFDGAVGISEADARSMLSAAEAEAAAATCFFA